MMKTQGEFPIIPQKTRYTIREFRIQTIREFTADSLLDTPEKVAEAWRVYSETAPWFPEEKEAFVLFLLNARRRCIGVQLVSVGTLDTLLVHPREVFRPACIQNAAAIIICHNHPSGDPTPSEADIKITRDLIRGGQLLKIDVLDHLVIGKPMERNPKGYVSLRELGYFSC